MAQQNVVIDCDACAMRVNSAVRGAVYDPDSESAIVLTQCPSCKGPLVGLTEVYYDENDNGNYAHAERVWPSPPNTELSNSVPLKAKRDIRDAQKCLSHNIFPAAVVMCGRALERLTKEKAPGKNSLADGLAELKAQGIIDDRLFQWATALRKERNLGAHAAEEDVSKENATDVVAFTMAIFEYVYTLTEKYADFVARKAAAAAKPPATSIV
ncbi:MAG TPA: DUF4145 domain-containing protein [Steroidobacteraceae bacterium]|nr:DUF4145 domain-containing protein [Steroidobacteraceae bacterium]